MFANYTLSYYIPKLGNLHGYKEIRVTFLAILFIKQVYLQDAWR